MDRFTLAITLGNDAMRSPEDVADALRRTADHIAEDASYDAGRIRDLNGNDVGGYMHERATIGRSDA